MVKKTFFHLRLLFHAYARMAGFSSSLPIPSPRSTFGTFARTPFAQHSPRRRTVEKRNPSPLPSLTHSIHPPPRTLPPPYPRLIVLFLLDPGRRRYTTHIPPGYCVASRKATSSVPVWTSQSERNLNSIFFSPVLLHPLLKEGRGMLFNALTSPRYFETPERESPEVFSPPSPLLLPPLGPPSNETGRDWRGGSPKEGAYKQAGPAKKKRRIHLWFAKQGQHTVLYR